MSSYIAERYAGILTKEDTVQLFEMLTEKVQGNKSKAARLCDLTGKTTYDWVKAKYVKLATRQKVLAASLNIDFLYTVDYLVKRSNDRATDILRTLLGAIFDQAVLTESAEVFGDALARFLELRRQYGGLIRDQIEDEFSDMMDTLREKGSQLSVQVPEETIDELTARELLDAIPTIGQAYAIDPQKARTLARTMNLPEGLIQILESTFERIRPSFVDTEANEEQIFISIPFSFDFYEGSCEYYMLNKRRNINVGMEPQRLHASALQKVYRDTNLIIDTSGIASQAFPPISQWHISTPKERKGDVVWTYPRI